MKRILLGTLFIVASFNAFADAPGGTGRGQGNMLFKGQRGMTTHVAAATTNGISGSNTFGITTGTNDCHANGALSYGGKPLLVFGSTMDELSEDITKGNDEASTAYAVVLGVQLQDREHFATVTYKHLSEIFNKSDVTAANVYANIRAVLRQDVRPAKYIEQA